jgi:hypothetical protein
VHKDLEEGYRWYEDREEGLGERFLSAVENKINHITTHPEVYGSRQNKAFREAKVDKFPYTITYRILNRKKEIHIGSVYHMSRHPGKKYRR